jgi:proteasome activator subunit 4
LKYLAWEYLNRLKEEELPTCTTPQGLRLTPELSNRFVEIIKGVTFQMMFSKDQRALSQNNTTLRSLAWITPKLIIPGVLERAYPSLESLTETHRTTSVISALNAIAIPLLNRDHYPQGGKHLLPLLHLTVPGVDLNDPAKTWHTLVFVATTLLSVPVKDLTESGNIGFEWGGMEGSFDSEEVVDLEFEDSVRKASTGEFEEWLMKFLRRIIFMVRLKEGEGNVRKGS